MSGLFEENTRKEERIFLSLCSPADKQKLMQQIPMSYNDYLRLTCIISNMNLVYYQIKINELFPDFYKMRKQMLKRHNEILQIYPDYYEDEDFYKTEKNWLAEFFDQISNESQKRTYFQMFHIEDGGT